MSKKKTPITMRIDPDLLAWYKAQSGSYQLTIQEVLHRHMVRTTNPLPGDLSMSAATKPPKKTVKPDKEKGSVSRRPVGPLDEHGFPEKQDAPHPGDPLNPTEGRFINMHDDASKAALRLELVRQPLYDTQVHGTMFDVPMSRRDEYMKSAPPLVFFQTGGGPNRGPAITNVVSNGHLTWPKCYDIDGIRISFSHLVDISEAHFEIQLGEKIYLNMPLKNMERDDDPIKDAEYGPLLPRMRLKHVGIAPTIYIPPVQWFAVTIHTGGKHFESAEVRVQLDGMLRREIC